MLLAVKGQRKVINAIDTLKRTVFSLRTALTTLAVSLGLGSFIQAAIKLDTMKRGLLAVSDNALEASKSLKTMEEIARLPGLRFQEAVDGMTKLRAAGFDAKFAATTLREVGNALATAGMGAPELERVILQMTQMKAAGKLIIQDLRPVIQTVPILGKVLKEQFGSIMPEAINSTVKSTDEFLRKWVEGMGKLPRVSAGPRNALENIQDVMFRLRAFVGDRLLPAMIGAFEKVEITIKRNQEGIVKFANFLGNVFRAIIDMTSAISKWVMENKKVVLIVAAIGAAVLLLTNPIAQVGIALVASVEIWKRWGEEIMDILKAIGNLFLNMFSPTAMAQAISDASATFALIGIRMKDAIIKAIDDDVIGQFQKKFLDLFNVAPTGMIDPIQEALKTVTKLPTQVGGGDSAQKLAMDIFKFLGVDPEAPLGKVKDEFAGINDVLTDLLYNMNDFVTALEFVGMRFEGMFGIGTATFEGLKGASSAYYNTIQSMSKAYFKNEADRLINFKELSRQVWEGAKIAALNSIAEQLQARAKQWGAEALAALAAGNIASAAKFGAAAALAGGASAVLSGRAEAYAENAQSRLAIATGQETPLTPEERAAGIVRTRSGSFSGRTASFSQQPANITIAPVTTFNNYDGGVLVIGSSGIEEAAAYLSDTIVGVVMEATKNGQLS